MRLDGGTRLAVLYASGHKDIRYRVRHDHLLVRIEVMLDTAVDHDGTMLVELVGICINRIM